MQPVATEGRRRVVGRVRFPRLPRPGPKSTVWAGGLSRMLPDFSCAASSASDGPRAEVLQPAFTGLFQETVRHVRRETSITPFAEQGFFVHGEPSGKAVRIASHSQCDETASPLQQGFFRLLARARAFHLGEGTQPGPRKGPISVGRSGRRCRGSRPPLRRSAPRSIAARPTGLPADHVGVSLASAVSSARQVLVRPRSRRRCRDGAPARCRSPPWIWQLFRQARSIRIAPQAAVAAAAKEMTSAVPSAGRRRHCRPAGGSTASCTKLPWAWRVWPGCSRASFCAAKLSELVVDLRQRAGRHAGVALRSDRRGKDARRRRSSRGATARSPHQLACRAEVIPHSGLQTQLTRRHRVRGRATEAQRKHGHHRPASKPSPTSSSKSHRIRKFARKPIERFPRAAECRGLVSVARPVSGVWNSKLAGIQRDLRVVSQSLRLGGRFRLPASVSSFLKSSRSRSESRALSPRYLWMSPKPASTSFLSRAIALVSVGLSSAADTPVPSSPGRTCEAAAWEQVMVESLHGLSGSRSPSESLSACWTSAAAPAGSPRVRRAPARARSSVWSRFRPGVVFHRCWILFDQPSQGERRLVRRRPMASAGRAELEEKNAEIVEPLWPKEPVKQDLGVVVDDLPKDRDRRVALGLPPPLACSCSSVCKRGCCGCWPVAFGS